MLKFLLDKILRDGHRRI